MAVPIAIFCIPIHSEGDRLSDATLTIRIFNAKFRQILDDFLTNQNCGHNRVMLEE